QANYAETPDAAAERAEFLRHTYQQPVRSEPDVPGDDFTVPIMGTAPDLSVLPLIRYRFDQLPAGALPVMGYEAKWEWDTPEAALDILECPASVVEPLRARIR